MRVMEVVTGLSLLRVYGNVYDRSVGASYWYWCHSDGD